MSFFNKFLSGAVTDLSDFIRRIVPLTSPFTVQDVEASAVAKYESVMQEELFALYKDNTNYLGIIRIPIQNGKLFSMFQGITDAKEASNLFTMFSFRLQVFVRCSEKMADKAMLQIFSDSLRENPSWTCAHLAAKLHLTECFGQDAMLQSINVADEEKGRTPIMVALGEGEAEANCVKELLLRGAKLNVTDKQGLNVFHYAVKAHCAAFINQLASKDKSMINGLSSVGETALHEACLEAQPECIEVLLRWGADPMLTKSTRYPIHCAAKSADERCIIQLCRWSHEQVHLKDHLYGATPLHWAKTRACIYTLCDNEAPIDAVNNEKETALHIAVKRNRFDCALSLVIRCADTGLINSKNNSALHAAVNPYEVLDDWYVSMDSDLLIKDFGEMREYNTGQLTYNRNDNWEMTQLLIVFGADVNQKNSENVTPRHLAATSRKENAQYILYLLHMVGAIRCSSGTSSMFDKSKGTVAVQTLKCQDGCSATGNFNGKSKNTPLNPEHSTCYSTTFSESLTDLSMPAALSRSNSVADWAPASTPSPVSSAGKNFSGGDRLLSLDGGGIRGMILMQVLLAVEKAAGKPIKECFDWISGTSTGAILALAIVHGKTLRSCMGMYFELKDKVFTGKRPYSSELLEQFMKKEFGETSRMSEIDYPKVMVTGVLADRYPAELHLFRNYDIPGMDMKTYRRATDSNGAIFEAVQRPNEQLVWMAARASGAAPTFFRASGRYLDGGLMSNNPTLDMLTEVHQYNVALKSVGRGEEARPLHVVLSVGTGCIPVRKSDACDVYRPEGLFDIAKVAFGAKNLIELLIDQATQSNGHVVDRAAAWCSMLDVPFYRFSPHLSEDLPLDCSDDQQLINMLWETQVYLSQRVLRVKQLASLLV